MFSFFFFLWGFDPQPLSWSFSWVGEKPIRSEASAESPMERLENGDSLSWHYLDSVQKELPLFSFQCRASWLHGQKWLEIGLACP